MIRDEMLEVLAMIDTNYPGQIKSPKEMADMWMLSFGAFSKDELIKAVAAHMLECEFLPKISDIVKRVGPRTQKPKFGAAEKRAGVVRNHRTYDEIRSGKFRKDKRPVDLRLEAENETDL